MRCKILIPLLFICSFSSVSATTLLAPFPAIGVSSLNMDLRYNLIQKDQFELFTDLGLNVDWSVFPAYAVPSSSLDIGINGSFYFNKNFSGFNIRLGTALSFNISPFFYKDDFYEMDYLLASNTDLILDYRIKLNDNFSFEPYIGGRVSFFGSLSSYSGVKPFISLLSGVSFSFSLDRLH